MELLKLRNVCTLTKNYICLEYNMMYHLQLTLAKIWKVVFFSVSWLSISEIYGFQPRHSIYITGDYLRENENSVSFIFEFLQHFLKQRQFS